MPIIFSTKKLTGGKNSLGSILKNTRLKHKLKLHHIEQYTNIRKSYIVAIENNEWEKLPSLNYAKNFVLNYAKFLELDLAKIKNRFEIETKTLQNNSHIKLQNERSFWQQLIITPRTVTIFTSLTIFAIIGLYAYFQINYFIQTPQLNISEPADYTVVAVNKVNIVGQTNPDNVLYVNNQPLTTDKNGNFQTPIQLKNGYNIIKVTAKNKIGKTTTSTKVVVANIDESYSDNSQLNLTIQASKKDIWVRIKNSSSESIFDGTITAGTNHSFTESGNIFISTSDAGATIIEINDQDLGTLGEDDQIIEDLQISNQPTTKNI